MLDIPVARSGLCVPCALRSPGLRLPRVISSRRLMRFITRINVFAVHYPFYSAPYSGRFVAFAPARSFRGNDRRN